MLVNNDGHGAPLPFAADKGMKETDGASEHSIVSCGRRTVKITGVKDVLSFDDSSVLLVTLCGNMALEGGELHVSVLDTKNGVVEVNGRLDAVVYYDNSSDGKNSKGRLGRLFK